MSCPFKQYKNIFGKEGEGAHSIRFLNLAIVDVIFTIIGALIISYFIKVNFFIVFIILNSDIYAENILAKFFTNSYDSSCDAITEKGIVISGILMVIIYIILDSLYENECL